MTMILLAMIAAGPPKELHVYPSLFTEQSKPISVLLSSECTGHIAPNAKHAVELVITCKKIVTGPLLLASFERLEGAYEKTTNSWLTQRDGTWELVTSTFLRDFEFEDPSVPGTKNITGQESSVQVFKKGKFEFVSNQLPAKRSFPIKK